MWGSIAAQGVGLMIIEPLLMDHLRRLDAPGARLILDGPGYFKGLIDNGPTFAGLTDEGEVIAAMGMIKQNPVSYRCWAVSDPKLLPRYLVAVCKLMRRTMDALYAEKGAKRIETIVRVGNAPGERWVKLLGFNNPQYQRHFDENGDVWLYERLSNG